MYVEQEARMRCTLSAFVSLSVAVLVLAACDVEPQNNNNVNLDNDNLNNNACTDECDTDGATRCDSNRVQTCQAGSGGCLAWQETEDCSETSATCSIGGGTATCVTGCSDTCPADGDQQCGGTVIQTCGTGAGGCLEWLDGTDCADDGQTCDDSGATPVCACDAVPDAPASPVPPNGAVVVDAAELTSLSWGAAAGATEYAVYLGTECPPPAYPDPAYQIVTDPTLAGLTLDYDVSYCWKVVALATAGCFTAGPTWGFTTAEWVCPDPVAGPPTVISGDAAYAPGTTSGTYVLTFSEPVQNVATNLTWNQVTGTGTLGAVTMTSPTTAEVAFSGVADGDRYTLTVRTGITDTCGNAMSTPMAIAISIRSPAAPGSLCTEAVDVTDATSFPVTLTGTFDDDPAVGGSCDTTPTNAVWFTYTPLVDGAYRITTTNATTTSAYSRLAVFEGTSCAPYGAQLACGVASGKTITQSVFLTAGTPYLILFHTDGTSYTMVNPSISIATFVPGPGDFCSTAIDLSAQPFPFTATGTFAEDPGVAGSCDTSPANAAWFTYSPPTTGSYRITASNGTSDTYTYSRLAVFEGPSCAPLGTQLACATTSTAQASARVDLVQGASYRIAFFTDGDSYTMVNPTITIAEIVPVPGDSCLFPVDVTDATFPHRVTGTFEMDPTFTASCVTGSPTNAVWYTYTPADTGRYLVQATNATTTYAFSRLVVFDSAACAPVGTELACVTNSSKSASAEVDLVAGAPVMIAFYTDGESYTMVDPTLTIAAYATGPGATCAEPDDVSAVTFPYLLEGVFADDATSGGSCDTTPTNAVYFSFTPDQTELYDIEVENGTGTGATRVAVFESLACGTLGTQVACTIGASGSSQAVATLQAGTAYLIMAYTDGASSAMVNPTITIGVHPFLAGEFCENAPELAGEAVPYTFTGTFGADPATGGTCDTTPNNAVWWTYTPTTTGTYAVVVENQTTTSAYTRLAVFTGGACSPLGAEVACLAPYGKVASDLLSLTAGTTYRFLAYTNGETYTMVDPRVSIQLQGAEGTRCSEAADVSAAVFPYELPGVFTEDATAGGSCDTTPTNTAYFSFTPGATDLYDIAVENGTGTGATRVAVFETLACSPLGTQVACALGANGVGMATASLRAGTAYLVMAYTDSATTAMVNPTITIGVHPFLAGELCESAPELAGETFPYAFAGTFGMDPAAGGTCDPTPNNAVWWTYTPTATGLYNVSVQNQTTTLAYTRLAVFTGNACAPLGAQVACLNPSSKNVSGQMSLTAGTTYLFMAYTDGESYTMVDPRVTIQVQTSEGSTCTDPADVTAVTFPYLRPGTFDDDPAVGGSCDAFWYNAIWYTYTAPATASYTITASNATSTWAYSRLAVFESASCSPYGAEVGCATYDDVEISDTVSLTAGVTYLILFTADGATYTMVDPEITIEQN
jgi:hypothetical protein